MTWRDMMHGCMVYTVRVCMVYTIRAETVAVLTWHHPCNKQKGAIIAPLWWMFKTRCKQLKSLNENDMQQERNESAREGSIALCKSDHQQQNDTHLSVSLRTDCLFVCFIFVCFCFLGVFYYYLFCFFCLRKNLIESNIVYTRNLISWVTVFCRRRHKYRI